MTHKIAQVLVVIFGLASALAARLPRELYSPLVSKKFFTMATNFSLSSPGYPQYTDSIEGDWQYFTANQWTAGFFPAALYQLNLRQYLCSPYSFDQSVDWLGLGRQWSEGVLPFLKDNTWQHDVGFVSYPFQEELRLDSRNDFVIDVVNTLANQLASRFSPIVGCTRSWDTTDPTDFQVIIDNMMNLELLFISAELTGNDTLRDIAISHADKTMVNHIRPDGSSFHVVEYNSTTGEVIRRRTAQGYADNSTWTRGQAWGIYGFAAMYKNTGLERYLETSRRMAVFFKNSMPTDGIVPWDFDAPTVPPPRPADSSAATIAATGLLLLSRIEEDLGNWEGARAWTDFAISLLDNITKLAWRPDWQSVLANGTVNGHASPPNQDTGTVYGDYFFVKAGNDLITMGLAEC
ncbi:glycoside hydrolase family 88 protein [Fomitiporia mediterranea MF3/22]|uniref:glycoside hydrolase family 88 protein n=1 Tax=Fomitiporia mediterranea (strain MF3/22) TaxID=694068 RepID=UPI000440757A|nr:glycoside hydrolase family 88 protein [Fomitiporia mediterranea MF3/22]EJD06112.1 glycoside hydrolase family 88 protein [Fomitiporia mediterranea MF3/22]